MEGEEGRLEGANSKVLVELLQDHRFHSVQPELEDLARRRNLQPEALVLRPVDSAARQQQVVSERSPQVRLEPQLEDLARRRNLQPEDLVLRREVSAPLLVHSQAALEPRRKCRVPNRDNGDQPRWHARLARLLTITKASPPCLSSRQALSVNRADMETCRLKF